MGKGREKERPPRRPLCCSPRLHYRRKSRTQPRTPSHQQPTFHLKYNLWILFLLRSPLPLPVTSASISKAQCSVFLFYSKESTKVNGKGKGKGKAAVEAPSLLPSTPLSKKTTSYPSHQQPTFHLKYLWILFLLRSPLPQPTPKDLLKPAEPATPSKLEGVAQTKKGEKDRVCDCSPDEAMNLIGFNVSHCRKLIRLQISRMQPAAGPTCFDP